MLTTISQNYSIMNKPGLFQICIAKNSAEIVKGFKRFQRIRDVTIFPVMSIKEVPKGWDVVIGCGDITTLAFALLSIGMHLGIEKQENANLLGIQN